MGYGDSGYGDSGHGDQYGEQYPAQYQEQYPAQYAEQGYRPPQYDDDSGWAGEDRIVPAFALTRGRTRGAGPDLPYETLVLVSATAGTRNDIQLQSEHRAILAASGRPISVVELGASLRVPIGVARVLVADLVDSGLLDVAPSAVQEDGRPDRQAVQRLLGGLRAR
jgi:hypothetical protein